MAQKVEVELVAKEGGFFAMLAKGIRSFQDFAEKGRTGAAQANQASKEHLATIEKMEARVRSLTQQWMKLKAQQVGGDTSKGLNDQLRATNRELAGAEKDLTRFKAGGLAPEPGQMAPGIASLKSLAANALGAYVGFEALKRGVQGSIEGTLNWVKTSMEMSNTLGISTEKASALKVAIGDVYATEEEFNTAVSRVTQSLNKKEETFTKLGVATRDANGNLRPTVDILLDTNTALGKLKAGTDRNLAANAVFGKGWQDLQKVMKLNNTVMQEAEAKAARLGLIVGGDLVEATNRFRAAQNDAEDTFQAMKIAVGQEILPLLTDFNEWAAEDGPAALGVLSGAIKVVITIWKTLVFIVQTVGAVVGTIIGGIITNVTGLGTVLWKVFTGDFKGAMAAGKTWWQDTKNNLSAGADEIKDRFEKLGMSLNQVWDPNLRPKGSTAPKGGGKRGDTFKEAKEEQDKEFAVLKAGLEQRREHFENRKLAEGQYVEWSKEQDSAYWRGVLDRQDLGEKTRAQAEKEYRKARRDVLKASSDDEAQVREVWRERDKAEALGELNDQQVMVERQRDLQVITAKEALEETIRIEEARYQVERASLMDRLALATLEPVEREKIYSQQEDLERQHQERLRGLRFQQEDLGRQGDGWAGAMAALDAFLQESANKFQQWKDLVTGVVNGVQNVFASTMNAFMQGEIKRGQILSTLWKGISGVMTSALSQIIAAKIKEWVVDRAISAWKTADSAKKVTENTAETATNTTSAASGIFKAHSGIPWVGVAIAIAMIAAMMAIMNGITGRAVGGRVDRPEITLLGEAGPEIVAPEKDFQDYTAGIFGMGMNLQSNLSRRQAQAAAYDSEAMMFARRTASAVQARANEAQSIQARGITQQVTHIHGHYIDTSERGRRQLGEISTDASRAFQHERGVVLRTGQVLGGL